MMNKLTDKNVPGVKFIKKYSGTFLTLILLSAVLAFATDKYLTASNLLSVLRQVSADAIIAFGMTYVLICGSIDLSVGSVCAFSGCVLVILLQNQVPFLLAVLISVLLGAIVGAVNGVLIAKLSIPPFIVTLATQFTVSGLAYLITNNMPIRVDNDTFFNFGNGSTGGIPNAIYYMVIIAVVTGIVLAFTKLGRWIYATGGNAEAAGHSGINTKRVIIIAHIICGLLAAFAGCVWASRVYSGQPTIGSGYEGNAIAAAVLGGTSFSGGVGTILGTILGALIIGIISNGLNLLQASYAWQLIVKGLVIILSVYIDVMRKKKVLRRS